MLLYNLNLAAIAALLTRASAGGVSVSIIDGRPHCTVTAKGNKKDDVPNLRDAFDTCGKQGVITFPEDQEYWIAEKLNPVVEDVVINWSGKFVFSNNITYWRNNSYHISFQNHWAGLVLTGKDLTILGNGTGGINGNGDTWYTAEAGDTQAGRPMPFVLWNVSNVVVKDFSIWEPQLWSFNIMNGTDILVENLYVNATATKAPSGDNWVQNTDGFDTMDVQNVTLRNFEYTGGDDCIAVKPRSFNVSVYNVTCHSGNGIAIGSLGQYLEDSSVEDVYFRDLKVPNTRNGIYIKTWMGDLVYQDDYESEYQPRGGGWGVVNNITFENVDVTNATRAFIITQDNGDDAAGDYTGTSKMTISNVVLKGFNGTLASTSNTVSISCSKVHPCEGIYLSGMKQIDRDGDLATLSCKYTAENGVHGLGGC
ncbi:putative galacturan 1,4-alpha-galacturonidase C [Xylariaceae sp. FL1651]|nr:putative galacturan 1,4-alpha-galacturonidase C [Xylariaceae sp. FL1651]